MASTPFVVLTVFSWLQELVGASVKHMIFGNEF